MSGLPDLAVRAPATALASAPNGVPRGGVVERVNRAIDHVLAHLAEPLKLDDVAAAAHLSPFHFHRVFQSVVGETVHDFVKRVRLERALALMAQPGRRTLTEVALACGFASSSDFSRSFRARYGVAPSAYDLRAHREAGRRRLQQQVVPAEPQRLAPLPAGANPDAFEVRLHPMPARRVAYQRAFRPYEGDGVLKAFEQLHAWARGRGLEGGQWLGYQWDDPDLVALEHCRYDVGLEVPAGTRTDGGIGVVEFPPMLLAEIAIAGPVDLEMRAIDHLFRTWLPASRCVPAPWPAFEAWNGLPFAHGSEHFELRLQLPVERLPG